MMREDLDARVKAFEAVEAQRAFPPDRPVVIRLDGRGFSRFTRPFAKPFDPRLSGAMRAACRDLLDEAAVRAGYVQSDEITLLLERRHENDALPFSGRVQKLVSTFAARASCSFLLALQKVSPGVDLSRYSGFDARAWSVPDRDEAVAAVLWRILDARRNGVSAACRSVARPSEMRNLSVAQMRDLMAERDLDPDTAFDARDRLGVILRRERRPCAIAPEVLARIPPRHRPANPEVMRSLVTELQVSDFLASADRAGLLFGDEVAANVA